MKLLFRLLVTVLTVLIFIVPLVMLVMWVVTDPQPWRLVVAGLAVLLLMLVIYFILSTSPLTVDKSSYRRNEKMRITLTNSQMFNWDDSFTLERVGKQWEEVEFAPRRVAHRKAVNAVAWEATAPDQPGNYWLSKTVSVVGDPAGKEKTFRVRVVVRDWSVRIGN